MSAEVLACSRYRLTTAMAGFVDSAVTVTTLDAMLVMM